MLRLGLIALILGLVAGPAAAAPQARQIVVVTGPVIHLGDLFTETGGLAGIAVAPAPAPGGRTILDAAWLAARAREQALDWQPQTRYDQVIVERASQAIPAEAIAAEIRRQLGDRLPQGETQTELDNAALRLFVPAGAAPDIAVDGLTFDARSGRFSAYVSAPGGTAADAERVRVTGHVARMVELPVLTRPVAAGETIAAKDVATIALRGDRASQGYLTDAAALVGRAPRRPLRAGEPVRPGDVQIPILVRRGELVTIILEGRALLLTAQGKAMEDGAMGAAIHVGNARSGRVIDATVTGPGAVAVAAGPRLAAR